MSILNRYILREIALHFVAVTGVLFVILAALQFAKVLYEAASNQFSRGVVLSLLGLTSLQYLIVLVPIGFFLAILLAIGRFYHDSEMAAMQACGVGPRQLFRPVTALGALIIGVLAWLSFSVVPHAAGRAHEIRLEALREARFASLEPQRFLSFAGGDAVYYAESVDKDGILYNVFVQRRVGDKIEVVTAKRAEQRGVGESQQTFILYDGERYEGVPGSGEFRIVRFGEHGIPVHLPMLAAGATRIETKPTMTVVSSSDPLDRAEFEQRLSVPLMTMVLAIIAVPLARLRPRQGRYSKMGLALLAYFIYLLLIKSARVWVEQQTVPTVIGMWWLHAIALSLALWLLLRQDPIGAIPRTTVAAK